MAFQWQSMGGKACTFNVISMAINGIQWTFQWHFCISVENCTFKSISMAINCIQCQFQLHLSMETTGTNGTNGTNGTTGTKGKSGTNGTTGMNGTSRLSEKNGMNGTNVSESHPTRFAPSTTFQWIFNGFSMAINGFSMARRPPRPQEAPRGLLGSGRPFELEAPGDPPLKFPLNSIDSH